MKTDMTSKERILATCRGLPTDHVPFHLEVHPGYLDYDPSIANWKNQFERTDFLLSYGVDAMVEVWLPEPTFCPDVSVRSGRIEKSDEQYPLLWKEYDTPAGTLRQVIRETPDLYDWHKINRNTCGPLAEKIDGVGLIEDVNPSRSVEFLIKGPEDLEKMRYLFQPPCQTTLSKWREQAVYAKSEAERRNVVFLARRLYEGSAMLWLTDAVKSMCTFDSNPEYIGEFLDIIHKWQMSILQIVLDLGIDMVTRFGYYDGTNFWGVNHFDRWLHPHMDEEADLAHQYGVLLSQQQSEALTQQVKIYKDMKVDILRDVDPVQGYEDLALLKRELGQTKTLMGGLNCDVWLVNASRSDVDQYIPDIVEQMSSEGRFILHPIPGVYGGVPWEKVEWVIDAWKQCA